MRKCRTGKDGGARPPMDISKFSSHFRVRSLTGSDTDLILDLCQGNPLFYEYTDAGPTAEQILDDMEVTPPGTDRSAKYYIGFFEGEELAAVMDLIDGWPEPETAWIRFFMVNRKYQGKQIGSSIIAETAYCLRTVGKTAIRLGIDKGNPQSARFWKKNGFKVLYETEQNGWTRLTAEKSLTDRIIAACGNDCAACPRYTAPPFEKTEEELHHTAELWMKIGYRDRIVTNGEIACMGCRPENWCRYHTVKCCEDRGIKTCAECPEYPCETMKDCFAITRSFEPKCREVCTEEEYRRIRKAFFEKEKNLSDIQSDSSTE